MLAALSACLLVDVGLVDKRVEYVDHAVDVPHGGTVLQLLDLLRRTAFQLSTKLHKALVLQSTLHRTKTKKRVRLWSQKSLPRIPDR